RSAELTIDSEANVMPTAAVALRCIPGFRLAALGVPLGLVTSSRAKFPSARRLPGGAEAHRFFLSWEARHGQHVVRRQSDTSAVTETGLSGARVRLSPGARKGRPAYHLLAGFCLPESLRALPEEPSARCQCLPTQEDVAYAIIPEGLAAIGIDLT